MQSDAKKSKHTSSQMFRNWVTACFGNTPLDVSAWFQIVSAMAGWPQRTSARIAVKQVLAGGRGRGAFRHQLIHGNARESERFPHLLEP